MLQNRGMQSKNSKVLPFCMVWMLNYRKLVAKAKQKQQEDDLGEYVYKVRGLHDQIKIMKYRKVA